VKVTHNYDHYQLSSDGGERLYSTYKVVEHWPVNKKTSKANEDCLGFRLPFQQIYSCGLRSHVKTEAEIEIQVSGGTLDTMTWSEASGTNYFPKNTNKADGEARDNEGKPDGPKTPGNVEFAPPTGSGDSTQEEKILDAKPTHCKNWHSYLRTSVGGGYHNTHGTATEPGTWYSPDGRVVADPPEDVSGMIRTTSDSESSSSSRLLAPIMVVEPEVFSAMAGPTVAGELQRRRDASRD